MKPTFLCLALSCLSLMSFSQHASTYLVAESTGSRSVSGIEWTEGLTWQQVKQKAKKENKYIFIDCYATWCGPCKQMDKDVYSIDSVGDFLNDKFIAVKLQMDITKNDDGSVRNWYKTAKEMGVKYRIAAYPSYLFFTPNGEVATKQTGYKDPGSFLQMARDATDPSKHYFVLLKNYKKGRLDHAGTASLIKMAKQIGDTADYRQLINSYYVHLKSQPHDKLYTKEKIEFIASTITRSNEVLFVMFYPDGSAVDKVMGKVGYARKVVDGVITKEKVNPILRAADAVEHKPDPDWDEIYQTIAKDYPRDYADRNVYDAKISWYSATGRMGKFAKAINDKFERFPPDTSSNGEDFRLNNVASIIFMNVQDTAELKRTINWMTGVVRRGQRAPGEHREYGPYYMDTYANLLYKIGEMSEALQWQELAIAKGREIGIAKGAMEAIEANLNLMKKGEPTW